MLISTSCPRCQTVYQVQEDLRGKAMRCPRPECRHVFLVGEEPPPPLVAPSPAPLAGPSAQQSGSVGDLIPLMRVEPDEPPSPEPLVPILPVEPVVEEFPLEVVAPPEEALPSWHEPPPVRRRGTDVPGERPRTRTTERPVEERKTRHPERPAEDRRTHQAEEEAAGPRLIEAAWDAPPPVRRGAAPLLDTAPELPLVRTPPHDQPMVDDLPLIEDPAPPEPASQPALPAKRRGRAARWVILTGCFLTVALLAGGSLFVYSFIIGTEAENAAKADRDYEGNAFDKAARLYETLFQRYPSSENRSRYEFRWHLSDLRKINDDGIDKQLDEIETFIKENQEGTEKTALLREHAQDVAVTLVKRIKEWAEPASSPSDDSPLKVVARAREVLKLAKGIIPRGEKGKELAARLDEAEPGLAQVEVAVARWKKRKSILDDLRELVSHPSFPSIVQAEKLLEQNEGEFPGLSRSGDVVALLDQLFEAHPRSVKYVPVPDPKKLPAQREEDEPAIVFDPVVDGTPGRSRDTNGLVLALARGVLYGQDQESGRIRWIARVGIDITTLPVRVPPQPGSPERILVLSSDTQTLTALDTRGDLLWRYPIKDRSLGRPVVVGQRAYLATYRGEIHEIELIEGKLLGRFLVHHRLTMGGTREPDTSRVYFPADNGCVYVIDVAKKVCESVLYSRHPAGALRGEVLLVGPQGDATPGRLILTQTAGLNAVELRVFDLPLRGRSSAAQALDPEARLEGWTWFRPYHDSEKILMVSDTAALGLFGIRQARNRDQAVLFPLLPDGSPSLAPLLADNPGNVPEQRRGRAEVVELAGEDLWVLALGRLQRLRLAWDRQKGPRLVKAWRQSLEVGSPLHASQTTQTRTGRSGLVVVTQAPRRASVWASAVDDESGELLWRRQLGIVCEREPLALAAPGQSPLLLVVDQGGALFELDPGRYKVQPGEPWLSDSKPIRLADALDENPDQPVTVLPASDGQSATIIACPGDGKEIVVRHVTAQADPRRLAVEEGVARLPDDVGSLRGRPAIVGKHLVLPLGGDEGKLVRLPLPLPAKADVEQGSDWRAERAPPEARGGVLAVGGDHFVTSDGLRQMHAWKWPADGVCQRIPAADSALDLPDRLITAPVHVPTPAGKPFRYCVGDVAGKVTLVEMQPSGAQEVRRTWRLGGAITDGPFIRVVGKATRVVVVVDRKQLVWIDPNRDRERWTYTAHAEAIIGRPRLAGDLVVVADQSGRYVGLNPRTGVPVGDGYQIKGSIAPVCCPVSFHPDRLLAPLSDGTLLLLAVKRLREGAPAVPPGEKDKKKPKPGKKAKPDEPPDPDKPEKTDKPPAEEPELLPPPQVEK